MIKAAIHNAIDFTSGINRVGFDYDPLLQRQRSLMSNDGFLVFKYTPSAMGAEPTTKFSSFANNGTVAEEVRTHDHAIELDDSWILFYDLSKLAKITLITPAFWVFSLKIGTEIIFSENCECFIGDELVNNTVIKLKGYNDDFRHGYLNNTYPACGFFKFSDLNNRVFGSNKIEFKYSFGRSKILRSENFVKKRLTFVNLTMYNQNLLKFLCNCQNFFINGVQHQIVSDFTEINKDPLNELCDLQAEFIETGITYFDFGAYEKPSEIIPKNLFNG